MQNAEDAYSTTIQAVLNLTSLPSSLNRSIAEAAKKQSIRVEATEWLAKG